MEWECLRKLWTILLRLGSGSFPPSVRFKKREIHTGFHRFLNLRLGNNLSPPALAEWFRASLTTRWSPREKMLPSLRAYQKQLFPMFWITTVVLLRISVKEYGTPLPIYSKDPPKSKNNPNPSPAEIRFGLFCFGTPEGTRYIMVSASSSRRRANVRRTFAFLWFESQEQK